MRKRRKMWINSTHPRMRTCWSNKTSISHMTVQKAEAQDVVDRDSCLSKVFLYTSLKSLMTAARLNCNPTVSGLGNARFVELSGHSGV